MLAYGEMAGHETEIIQATKTPFEFYCKLQLHTLAPIAEKITQDLLLLAGEKDHYIPKEQFEKARAELVNARSLKARMFTVEEGGGQHCQIGNHKLAIDEIIRWLEQIEDSDYYGASEPLSRRTMSQ